MIMSPNKKRMLGSDHLALLRLLDLPGLGPSKVNAIVDAARKAGLSPSDILLEEHHLSKFISPAQGRTLHQRKQAIEEIWHELQERDVHVIWSNDRNYPERLKSRLKSAAPPLLFAMGNVALLSSPSLGFCGSRKASERGLATAFECATVAVESSLTVASGYAAGVDLAAHKGALESGGCTIAILAEGILRFRVKREVGDLWDWNRCVAVSEFLPRIPWTVSNAMKRNFTICGLSSAMVLIEAGETGGSFEAGKAALNMDVPLFTPIYDGMPPEAIGNRILLKQGAHPLMKNKASRKPNFQEILRFVRASLRPGQLTALFSASIPLTQESILARLRN